MVRHRSSADHGGERGHAADTPAEIGGRGLLDVLRRVKAELADDHTSLSAAGVAYYGSLAAIPALAAVVSVYGMFTDPAEVQRRVESLFGALPGEARALLSEQLSAIVGQRQSALGLSVLVSVALSLWSASSGMGHLIEAVNVAYDEHDRRSWPARKAWALLFTVGAVLFLITSVAAVAGLGAIVGRAGVEGPLGWLLRLLWVPVVMAGFAVGLAVLYRYGPDRAEPRWRWVSWGSALAVVIWIVASAAFQVYVANFGSYNETYGSLAAVVILLFWLYLTAFVVLLGAELNAELEHQTARDTTTGPPKPIGTRDAVVADEVAATPR
ncbi:MAG: YihY/virulence factor BrkB family protein [Acidimicrobiales bacterium]|nr:YihY/virulence factor BrkB family protein [Acidimicrobiales bacterium]